MKKLIALLLALFMLCALFASCDGVEINKPGDTTDSKPGDSTTDGKSGDSTGDSTETPDKSEVTVRDFGGADYKVLYNSVIPNGDYNEFSGSLGGDLVQYAIAERQYEVETQYNVSVLVTMKPGGWGERKDFTAAVRAEKMSGGTDEYDLIATHSVYLGWMGIEGLGLDMSKYSDYIDFSQPWWNQNLYDALNLQDHVFMMIGDIACSVYEFINVMFVNETQFENQFADQGGVEELYELVDAGEWTWEKLWEYASVYGTGAVAGGDGKYGIYTGPHAWRASFVSQDAHLFQQDSSGKLTLPGALPAKESGIVQDMVNHYAMDNLAFDVFGFSGTGNNEITPIFQAGNVLFYPQTLDEAKKLFSGATEEYGIVPLPKYDTMQESYLTQCRDTVTAVMLMCTTKDDVKAAIVTEAMAYYGHELITPAYYENSLVNRFLDRYTEILDTIRAGLTYQPADCYVQNSSGDAGSIRWDKFHTIVLGNGKQADTVYAEGVATGRNELATFYKKLEKLGITY